MEPAYEDVEAIPDQAHVWNEASRFGGPGIHEHFTCDVCGELSDCIYESDPEKNLDCLRDQAWNRNWHRQQRHTRAVRDYEAQMRYYRTLVGQAGGTGMSEDILQLLHEAPTPCVITDSTGSRMVKLSDDPYAEQYFDLNGRPDFRRALQLVPPLSFELHP